MVETSFQKLIDSIARRRAKLKAAGVRLPTDDELRNDGSGRSPEKREFLRQIDERAVEAGIEPVKQND